MIVVPKLDLQSFAQRGAVGLLVPGSGAKVSGRGARAALVQGRVEPALTGGVPDEEPLVELAQRPADVSFYIVLPPPGEHTNDRRYPIAVVGDGYHGLLESSSTRIPGLVSIADVAPSAVDLEAGEKPAITSKPSADASTELAGLDRRLDRSRDARGTVDLILMLTMLAAGAGALLLRSPLLGRAALLVAPAAISLALLLSGLDVERAGVVVPIVAVGTPLLALAGALLASTRARLLALLLVLIASYGVVLAAWPEVSSLAAIGPHPDRGGRYYGLTNQTSTLVLAPSLAAGALAGLPWLAAVGLLALAVVGLSATGADGGGLLVTLTGFGVLALRLAELRLTLGRVVALCAAVVAAGVLVVGIDAAAGGSSHVTRAVGDGPGALADDLAHRADVSFRGPTSSPLPFLLTSAGLIVLVWIGTRRPRSAVVDAMLAGLAVSFVVNDTPQSVATFGALGALGLLAWRRTADL